jgi:hypothetical protein
MVLAPRQAQQPPRIGKLRNKQIEFKQPLFNFSRKFSELFPVVSPFILVFTMLQTIGCGNKTTVEIIPVTRKTLIRLVTLLAIRKHSSALAVDLSDVYALK